MERESLRIGVNNVLRHLLQCIVPMRVYAFLAKRVFRRAACLNKLSGSEQADWRQRIADVLSAPENLCIERVSDAGRIYQDTLVMHNGVRYYYAS